MITKSFKLPRTFGLRWLEALRSGGFRKTNGALVRKVEDSEKCEYCALGVAGKIANCEMGILDGYLRKTVNGHPRNLGDLPGELVGDSGLPHKIASMNDSNTDFCKIADWITENVELYEDEQAAVPTT